MIISKIIGGLGNQMFQYAAGRALSLNSAYSLKLDVSGFDRYKLHQGFELSRIFNGPFALASDQDVKRLLGWQRSPWAQRYLLNNRLAGLRSSRFIVEPHFNYWAGIKDTPDHSYMIGYWQSEKYFNIAKKSIQSDFTFKLPMSARNSDISDKITHCNSVGLHVRRGDYVKNAKTREVHGLASIEYYDLAIRYVSDKVDRPHLFIFSDDIDWVKVNLKTHLPTSYLDHNHGQDSYIDMRLMSLCRHQILANSSFSWWGAWLNRSAGKIVIAPKKWFANGVDAADLIPGDWISL